MKLADLLAGLEIVSTTPGVEELEVCGIADDSREDLKGRAFLCLAGEHHDSHDFIPQVAQKGAAAIICEHIPPEYENYPHVVLKSTRIADAVMWSRIYGDPADDLKVIAVTGTNGKTSITYMLKSILEEMGKKVGVIGTIRNMIGDRVVESVMTTPIPKFLYKLMAEMRDADVGYLVMEASSHALDYD